MSEWEDIPDETNPLTSKQVQNHFIDKGYEPHHAAGIAANLAQESGLNPNAVNPKSGAYGMAQWLGNRKVAFHNYAKATGGDVTDPAVQMDFVDHELNTTESKAKEKLLATKNKADAAVAFSNHFERAGNNEKNNNRRIALANKLPTDNANWQDASSNQWEDVPEENKTEQPTSKATKGSAMSGFLKSTGNKAINDYANIIESFGSKNPVAGIANKLGIVSPADIAANKLKQLAGTVDESQPGTTTGKIFSDIVTGIPLSASKVLPNIALGALHGYTTSSGDIPDKIKNAAIEGGMQGAVSAIPAGIGNIIKGFNPSKNAKYWMERGVQPTVGQGIEQKGLGPSIRQIEEASTSIPFLGGPARAARARAESEWDRHALQQAEIPNKVSTGGLEGNEAINKLGQDFSNEYSSKLAGHYIPLKPRLISDVQNTINNPDRYVIPEDRNWAINFIRKQFSALPQVGSSFPADGIKLVESNLGKKAREINQHNPELSNMLSDAQSAISKYRGDHLPSSVADDLKELDSKYAIYKRLEKASSYVGTDEGRFTPSHLLTAVKSMDKSVDKNKFAKGKALLQSEASKGKSVFTKTLGESGTAPRSMVGRMASGNAPEIAAAVTSLPIYASAYGLLKGGATRPVQKALLGGYSQQIPIAKKILKAVKPAGIAGYVLGDENR